ncbi:Non-specific serine/threonine protein kinase [Bertholletia excelsa]
MLTLILTIFILLKPASFSWVGPYNISFPSFDSASCGDGGKLLCMGSIMAGDHGSLSITSEHQVSKVGRVLVLANSSSAGDGVAFVLAKDDSPSPPDSFGSYMGIFDQSTEVDTYKNEYNPDGNHIAIDTKSIENPLAVKSLSNAGIDLKSGREVTVQIECDGWSKNLQISVAYAGDPLVSFLKHTMKIKNRVPSNVFAGFTAATGTLTESHQVLSWNFTSIPLPKESLGREKKNLIVIVVVPIVFVLVAVGLVAVLFVLRANRRKRERVVKKGDIEVMIAAASGPKLFSYKQLLKATANFSKENLLGSGGFGSVYKVVISDPHTTIAVKRFLQLLNKVYLAERCTTGRLRHKNLLQLQGWCHDHGELLLVYEYVPNGSLHRYIGKGSLHLDWETRYKILLGDVKPNNVMLDSGYNAHLGDFGLARLLQNEDSLTTMIAGTPGNFREKRAYFLKILRKTVTTCQMGFFVSGFTIKSRRALRPGPEVSFTGRATPESDVYSFGMVVLEKVCGKRSKGVMYKTNLVDGMWSLYEKGTLMECMDRLLEGKYEEEQVRRALIVGLACLHPDFMFRPRMRRVFQFFMNPEEPLMNLPEARPTACQSEKWLGETTVQSEL